MPFSSYPSIVPPSFPSDGFFAKDRQLTTTVAHRTLCHMAVGNRGFPCSLITRSLCSGVMQMTYDELMAVIRSSEYGDWLHDDGKGIFTLRNNLNIRIVEDRHTDENESEIFEEFHEAWATRHPNQEAQKAWYHIYYQSSFVQSFMLVAVDGARACLPPPKIGTTEIPLKDYRLAKAVDQLGTLDEYISRSGLTVSGGD